MKFQSLFLTFLVLCLAACSGSKPMPPAADAVDIERTDKHRGQTINPAGAMSIADLVQKMDGKTEMKAKVKAPVNGVCKVKGCWMTMQMPGDEDMRVTFKDYAFFMPKDIDDMREAVIQGTARYETTPVELLRHLAEDAGGSPEELAKITESKLELVFEADGVYLTK